MHSREFKNLMVCPKCQSTNTTWTIECRVKPVVTGIEGLDTKQKEYKRYEAWFNTSRFVTIECFNCGHFEDIDRKKARREK